MTLTWTPVLAVMLLALATTAGIITRWSGLSPFHTPVLAAIRGTAQLAVLSALIVVALQSGTFTTRALWQGGTVAGTV